MALMLRSNTADSSAGLSRKCPYTVILDTRARSATDSMVVAAIPRSRNSTPAASRIACSLSKSRGRPRRRRTGSTDFTESLLLFSGHHRPDNTFTGRDRIVIGSPWPSKQEVGMTAVTVGNPVRVMIVGAGTGGLCLAQGLKADGIAVEVFERDYSPTDR